MKIYFWGFQTRFCPLDAGIFVNEKNQMEEDMQTRESFEKYPMITDEEARLAVSHAICQVKARIPQFYDCFPAAASVGNFYPGTENDDWTNGFWTGEIWLSYEQTKDETFREAALHQVKSFQKRILDRVVVDHHDMGFLYSPSCVASYKLTGDERKKEAALLAADNLLGRFQEKGEFFQAWGKVGDPDNYRLIIDCLLNMPLLFWASEVTDDEKYRDHALRHIKTCMKYVVREDASTYHTYFFDPETGAPVKGVTAQGNRNGSIWARGQSWGVYGSAVSYKYLKNPVYIENFRRVTACFLEHLPANLVPYWDFDFDDPSSEPRDSSAAAIAACGMLEMAKYLEHEEAVYYKACARRLIKALTDYCLYRDNSQSNGILLHSTYAKASPGNTVSDSGVDECCLWGDYFYMEALVRLLSDWKTYW